MTPQEIRDAIAASPELQALQTEGNHNAIAEALSVGRTRVEPRMVSARGLAESLPGGPIAAEIILMKLEGARDAMLASGNQQQVVMGSLLRRQLSFLAGDGLDFGSTALRAMLDQFGALGILTTDEVTALKTIGVVPDPISHQQVSVAIEGGQ